MVHGIRTRCTAVLWRPCWCVNSSGSRRWCRCASRGDHRVAPPGATRAADPGCGTAPRRRKGQPRRRHPHHHLRWNRGGSRDVACAFEPPRWNSANHRRNRFHHCPRATPIWATGRRSNRPTRRFTTPRCVTGSPGACSVRSVPRSTGSAWQFKWFRVRTPQGGNGPPQPPISATASAHWSTSMAPRCS